MQAKMLPLLAPSNLLIVNIVTAILNSVLFSSPSEAVCRFGSADDCIFPCRCKDGERCNAETGDCPNGCAAGKPSGYPWRGPGCQIGNVAFEKQTYQHGVHEKFYAKYGVDGFLEGSRHTEHCAHPKADNNQLALWIVDLGNIYVVNNVTIYNTRNSKGSWRFQHFTLRNSMMNIPSLQSVCQNFSATIPPGGHVTLSCDGKLGRYVGIQRYAGGERNMFTLCEAVVIGHKYIDTDCSKCESGCSQVIGCTICKAGRQLPTCRKNCSSGFYGVNCDRRCGRCADNTSCAVDSGICKAGCQPWYGFQNCTVHIDVVDMDTLDLPTLTASRYNSVDVSWSAPSGVPSGLENHYKYVISAFTADGSVVIETRFAYRVTGDVTKATVHNLRRNTVYNVTVMLEANSRTETALGKPTPTLSVKTDCDAPDKPVIQRISAQKDNLTITYERVADSGCDHLTHLILDYRPTFHQDWTSIPILNRTSPVVVVLASGAYFVRIRAINNRKKVTVSVVHNAEVTGAADSGNSRYKTGVIAGSVVGVIAIVTISVAIVASIYICMRGRVQPVAVGDTPMTNITSVSDDDCYATPISAISHAYEAITNESGMKKKKKNRKVVYGKSPG